VLGAGLVGLNVLMWLSWMFMFYGLGIYGFWLLSWSYSRMYLGCVRDSSKRFWGLGRVLGFNASLGGLGVVMGLRPGFYAGDMLLWCYCGVFGVWFYPHRVVLAHIYAFSPHRLELEVPPTIS
jgi:hypothetical protein